MLSKTFNPSLGLDMGLADLAAAATSTAPAGADATAKVATGSVKHISGQNLMADGEGSEWIE